MKKINISLVLGIAFLLLMSSVTFAATSRDRFGFIEAIEDSEDSQHQEKSYKVLSVSGKEYLFDWDTVKVIYKDVYINVSGLDEGMKIKFETNGKKPEKITTITILSQHDMLINN